MNKTPSDKIPSNGLPSEVVAPSSGRPLVGRPAAAASPAIQRPLVYLETFGCQMNELDSELVRGQLGAMGYRFTTSVDAAGIVLFNTCSVREQAENKAYSRIGLIGKRKQEGGSVVLGVIGCMAERDGADMMRRHPQIDLLCGPGELDRLPQLIDNAFKTGAVEVADRVALQGNKTRRTATLSAAEDSLEALDLSRAFDPDSAPAGGRTAYVRITRGCNKFCTYCVVPHTRGAEVHRPPDHIVEECRRLADQGVIEITLLGQTVNHYRYTHGVAMTVGGQEAPQIGPGLSAFRESARGRGGVGHGEGGYQPANGARTTTFADLLKRIHDEVPAIQRLRFVTSYPRDFGDDILQLMAESPRICRYLHVPPQSGSDRILKLMNRGYSVGEYVEFIDRARDHLPDVCISGDIIVGFPTETDEDFQATVALLERVRFKSAFIFKYSPRPGTVAIGRYPDDVADPVKRRRNNDLLAIQSRIGAEVHAEWVGRTEAVFVEQIGRRQRDSAAPTARGGTVELGWERSHRSNSSAVVIPASDQRPDPGLEATQMTGQMTVQVTVQVTGRTSGDLIVAFDLPPGESPEPWLGRMVDVQIERSAPLILYGSACPV